MKSSFKVNPILIVVGIAAVVVFSLLAEYAGFLGAKAPAPIKVQQGQLFLVSYKTSKNVPAVKIELCRGSGNKTCTTLAAKATGTSALVTIPGSTPVGSAIIKVSERNTKLALNGKVQNTFAITVTKSNISSSVTAPTPKIISQVPANAPKTTINNSTGGGNVAQTPTPQPTPFIPSKIDYKLLKVCATYPNLTAEVQWYPPYATMRYRFPDFNEQWYTPNVNLDNTGTAIRGIATRILIPGMKPNPNDSTIKMEIQLRPPLQWLDLIPSSQTYTTTIEYANSMYDSQSTNRYATQTKCSQP